MFRQLLIQQNVNDDLCLIKQPTEIHESEEGQQTKLEKDAKVYSIPHRWFEKASLTKDYDYLFSDEEDNLIYLKVEEELGVISMKTEKDNTLTARDPLKEAILTLEEDSKV